MGAGSGLWPGRATAYTWASEALATIFVSFCSPWKPRSATSETCTEPLDLLIGPPHPFTLIFHFLLYLQVLPRPQLSIIMTQPWGGSRSVAEDVDGMDAVMVEGVMVRGSWERRPRELGGGVVVWEVVPGLGRSSKLRASEEGQPEEGVGGEEQAIAWGSPHPRLHPQPHQGCSPLTDFWVFKPRPDGIFVS